MMKSVWQELSPGICKQQPQCMGCEQAPWVLLYHHGAEGWGNPAPMPIPLRLSASLPRLIQTASWWHVGESSHLGKPRGIPLPSLIKGMVPRMPEAADISRCWGSGRRAATCCSALGIFALYLLHCYSRSGLVSKKCQ